MVYEVRVGDVQAGHGMEVRAEYPERAVDHAEAGDTCHTGRGEAVTFPEYSITFKQDDTLGLLVCSAKVTKPAWVRASYLRTEGLDQSMIDEFVRSFVATMLVEMQGHRIFP